ncbi:MAG: hypothetical protein ACFFD5_04660 [Candidatus Thorarchaeota archaeon]
MVEIKQNNNKASNKVANKGQTSEYREILNHNIWIEKTSYRIALISIFSALAVVLGYMLAYIPNIEMFTLTIFLSGFILGKKEGIIVGLLSSSIFTFFNPLGASPAPLFIYQIIHYSLTGLAGNITRNFLIKKNYFGAKEDLYVFPIFLIFGFTGAVITFIYDVISTVISAFLVSITFKYFIVTYMTGIIFTTIHLIGNVLSFVFLLPGLVLVVQKILD